MAILAGFMDLYRSSLVRSYLHICQNIKHWSTFLFDGGIYLNEA